MKHGILLFVLFTALPALAKGGECENSVTALVTQARMERMSYAQLAEGIQSLTALKDKVRAVRWVLPMVTNTNDVDGAIAILNHLRDTQSSYREEEGDVIFDITNYLTAISAHDLSRLIDATHYFKNKQKAFKLVCSALKNKIVNLEASGAAEILASIGRRQSDFQDEEAETALRLSTKLQTLTAAQLLKLVETARYTNTKVKLYEALIRKVSNINDFASVLQIFRSIHVDSQIEVEMFWTLSQLKPQMDAERLLALSRVAHTSRAQAKIFEYFEPMTKQRMQE